MALIRITADEYSELFRAGAWVTSISHFHRKDLESLGLLGRVEQRPSDTTDYSCHLKDEYWAYFTRTQDKN